MLRPDSPLEEPAKRTLCTRLICACISWCSAKRLFISTLLLVPFVLTALYLVFQNPKAPKDSVAAFFSDLNFVSCPSASLQDFRKAERSNADALFVPLSLTSDGQPVILSSRHLRTPSNRTIFVSEKSLAELHTLLPNASDLLQLDAFLKWADKRKQQRFIIGIEATNTHLMRVLLHFVAANDRFNSTLFVSAKPSVVYFAKKTDDRILTALLYRQHATAMRYDDKTSSKYPRSAGLNQKLLELADSCYSLLMASLLPHFVGADALILNNRETSEYAKFE